MLNASFAVLNGIGSNLASEDILNKFEIISNTIFASKDSLILNLLQSWKVWMSL
jgi:hypothetical protein